MVDLGSRRRRALAGAAAVVVAAVVVAVALGRAGGDDSPVGLTIRWGATAERPGCVYVPERGAVEATITIDGATPYPDTVTVTVSAYADENTSEPVGSGSHEVEVGGTVRERVVVDVPVASPPHVGEDDVAACRLSPLSVEY